MFLHNQKYFILTLDNVEVILPAQKYECHVTDLILASVVINIFFVTNGEVYELQYAGSIFFFKLGNTFSQSENLI